MSKHNFFFTLFMVRSTCTYVCYKFNESFEWTSYKAVSSYIKYNYKQM